jgi:hypothetical protein
MAANPEVERYIYDAAVKRGIDPNVAVEVARREALNVFDPNKPDLGGDDRSSFGPFQLHYGGRSKAMPNAGLGDEFTAKTGLRADDPTTWRQQIDFSLDHAKKSGWGPWMGAKAAGITGMAGIDGTPWNGTPSSGGGTAVASATPAAAAPAEMAFPSPDELGLITPIAHKSSSSLLADDLSSSVGPRVSGRSAAPFAAPADEGEGTSLPTLAATAPEAPPPALVTPPPPAGDQSALADLFKVKDIGQADAIDPMTGQPKIPKVRRAFG